MNAAGPHPRADGAVGRGLGRRIAAGARDFVLFYLLLVGLAVLLAVGPGLRRMRRGGGRRATEALARWFERVGGA